MKVCIVAMARSGGYGLGEWISTELNHTYYHEPIYNGISTEGDNIVVKYLITEIDKTENALIGWDKIIGLVRENERECAISQTYAVENKEWRRGYKLNSEWISERENVIKGFEEWALIQKEFIQNLNVFNVSYEGIYNRGEDIKRILEYLNIGEPKYLHLLNPSNRLRKVSGAESKPLI
jgi:hypothetical protein